MLMQLHQVNCLSSNIISFDIDIYITVYLTIAAIYHSKARGDNDDGASRNDRRKREKLPEKHHEESLYLKCTKFVLQTEVRPNLLTNFHI